MMGVMELFRTYKPLLGLMIPFFLSCVGAVIAFPAVTDITISGLGAIVVVPLIGSLSDDYGRKPLLIFSFAIGIMQWVVLSYSTSGCAVYIYYAVKTLAGALGDGATFCLILAYIADVMPEDHRASAVGFVMGSLSIAFIIGTSISRFLPITIVFQVAVVTLALATLYLAAFLPESLHRQPLVDKSIEEGKSTHPFLQRDSHPHKQLIRSKSTLRTAMTSIWNNRTLVLLALISFTSSFVDAGITASLLFYLKGVFNFAKDQFAQVFLLVGVCSMVTQLFLLPVLVHTLGVRLVMLIGLFFGGVHCLLYGIAWSSWVPYLAAAMSCANFLVFPTIGSMVSQAAAADEQGKMQGVISGVRSMASALAPLLFNAITATFLSPHPPLPLPGFAFLVGAAADFLALVLAFMLPTLTLGPQGVVESSSIVAPMPDEEVNEQFADPMLLSSTPHA
eukprot:SM000179S03417  [mRNA]  locus=s179:111102:115273:- [translate_table: standard]